MLVSHYSAKLFPQILTGLTIETFRLNFAVFCEIFELSYIWVVLRHMATFETKVVVICQKGTGVFEEEETNKL